jgi:hypothetical protein
VNLLPSVDHSPRWSVVQCPAFTHAAYASVVTSVVSMQNDVTFAVRFWSPILNVPPGSDAMAPGQLRVEVLGAMGVGAASGVMAALEACAVPVSGTTSRRRSAPHWAGGALSEGVAFSHAAVSPAFVSDSRSDWECAPAPRLPTPTLPPTSA